MFYPPAVWRPGPIEKQGYPGLAVNADKGVVCHSMVGYYAGAMIELDKTERRASWHFSVLQNGTVYQHYNTQAVTWHCGSREWNGKLIGIEHEGGFNPTDEPLTTAQRDASVALVRWLSMEHGFPLERQVALWEHNEIAPPNDPTGCPTHRIPWEFYVQEEDKVTEDDINKIVDRVKLVVLQSLGTIQSGDGDTFKKNISDLAHDGGNRTVDLMVQRGQVQPPK